MKSNSLKSPTEMPHCLKGEQQDSANFKMLHHKKDALLTDKGKVKEQLVEAEQSLEKIQEEEVRKSVSATDTQSEDEEESQFKTKAQEVKVKEFSFSSSSESDSEEEERGERVKDVSKHLIQAFAYLGVPNLIKTDNGPAYASQGFQKFCKRWSIQHKTGIPYSPQDAERPMWLPEHCVCPVDVPADTKDHEDDLDSTNIGTGAMDVGMVLPTIKMDATLNLETPPRPRLRYGKAKAAIQDILYREDQIRAKFFSVYRSGHKAFDLFNPNFKSTCQRFVEKYMELQNLGESDEEKLFVETGKALLAEGIILRRVKEARTVSVRPQASLEGNEPQEDAQEQHAQAQQEPKTDISSL
ncbi:hypothetical protein STEG23_028504 [Scotinomys teguina]